VDKMKKIIYLIIMLALVTGFVVGDKLTEKEEKQLDLDAYKLNRDTIVSNTVTTYTKLSQMCELDYEGGEPDCEACFNYTVHNVNFTVNATNFTIQNVSEQACLKINETWNNSVINNKISTFVLEEKEKIIPIKEFSYDLENATK